MYIFRIPQIHTIQSSPHLLNYLLQKKKYPHLGIPLSPVTRAFTQPIGEEEPAPL